MANFPNEVDASPVATRAAQRYSAVMSNRADALLREVLALPEADRAELAYELVASLDGATDADAEAEWAAEIERRADRARTDLGIGHEWTAVRDRLISSLRRG